jgi:hypothetical protein
MSVPLDRLYNFLQDICNHDVLIYRYFPHGSKKMQDCKLLAIDLNMTKIYRFNKMYVFCHDQELLNSKDFPKVPSGITDIPLNAYRLLSANTMNKYDRIIVVHSELNSPEVTWFEENGAVTVYWWSHAVIARDWFRYANIDPKFNSQSCELQQDFLIYNRAWQGTREYRLKFAELVVSHNLTQHCRMGFNPIDEQHYHQHQFSNSAFEINNHKLENHFPTNNTNSSASADYCSQDYLETGLEIVLETIVDDQRWHLTEKTLRPIACGHPFMILGTPGILRYLRKYGFKTFSPLIDESYDDMQDPVERMQAIIDVMKRIAAMSTADKLVLYQQMQAICSHNKDRFFSDEFLTCVIEEFKQNFEQAAEQMKKYQTGAYFKLFLQTFKNTTSRLPVPRQEIVKMWQILHNANCQPMLPEKI